MNPQEPARNNQSTNEWFTSIDPPVLPPPEQPQEPKKNRLLLIAAAVAVAISATVGGMVLFNYLTRPQCLTVQDYQLLTNQPVVDTPSFSPRDSFYTTSVFFVNGGNEYTQDSKKDADKLMRSIGEFYTKVGTKKPIAITVSAGYTTNDTKDAAQARLDLIVRSLIKSGIDEASIVTEPPEAINSGDELSADSAELATARVYVSIASIEECSE